MGSKYLSGTKYIYIFESLFRSTVEIQGCFAIRLSSTFSVGKRKSKWEDYLLWFPRPAPFKGNAVPAGDTPTGRDTGSRSDLRPSEKVRTTRADRVPVFKVTGGAVSAKGRQAKMISHFLCSELLPASQNKTAGLKSSNQNVTTQHFRMITPKYEMSYEAIS